MARAVWTVGSLRDWLCMCPEGAAVVLEIGPRGSRDFADLRSLTFADVVSIHGYATPAVVLHEAAEPVPPLAPFWRYYGGKYRAAPRYPKPLHPTIIEPFAGAAGYSLRYPERNVVLVEKYPIIAEIWRYLIAVRPSEVLRIPEVEHVDELPSWVPEGARYLVGFCMNAACTAPCRKLSVGAKRLRAMGRHFEGWCAARRERTASQVDAIKHWQILEGDYTIAPDIEATWFIDPPYQVAGKYYIHADVDYPALAAWCRTRHGQTMVCENAGATWLPFQPFASCKSGPARRVSEEVLWTHVDHPAPQQVVLWESTG